MARIYLPKTIQYINSQSFENCDPSLVFAVEKGSYAFNWAIKNNKKIEIVNSINKRSGCKNLFDDLFDRNLTENILSHNAFIAFVFQTGEIYGYNEGKVKIEAVLKNGEVVNKTFYVEAGKDDIKIPILLNRYNGVSNKVELENLKEVEDKYKFDSKKKIILEEEALKQFIQMNDDAKKDNLTILINFGYRDNNQQRKIFKYYEDIDGIMEARKRVAPAGFSQHNFGLAIDIKTENNKNNDEMYKWVENNAYKYGYCLKNLEGKEDITGSIYEPWHLYYIGDVEIAKELSERKITLEEYLLENIT